MLKLIYFVPDEYLDSTKQAIFAAGAGRIGDYEHCVWQVKELGSLDQCKERTHILVRSDKLNK